MRPAVELLAHRGAVVVGRRRRRHEVIGRVIGGTKAPVGPLGEGGNWDIGADGAGARAAGSAHVERCLQGRALLSVI